ncbi:MAG: hypothetical protein KDC38_06930 [Planctomycetes bacterium]|nr:hypothetical protein [Planctomycetota bacterium]
MLKRLMLMIALVGVGVAVLPGCEKKDDMKDKSDIKADMKDGVDKAADAMKDGIDKAGKMTDDASSQPAKH